MDFAVKFCWLRFFLLSMCVCGLVDFRAELLLSRFVRKWDSFRLVAVDEGASTSSYGWRRLLHMECHYAHIFTHSHNRMLFWWENARVRILYRPHPCMYGARLCVLRWHCSRYYFIHIAHTHEDPPFTSPSHGTHSQAERLAVLYIRFSVLSTPLWVAATVYC